ncbi:hypothetical protein [Xanthobacter agilis]|uniref:Uncharacterized protein n=1 Tax=Xanthobacter agilis TaxID=47492 RepID=A0ABU0L8G6_XANAG|nr:hypothetical protein [Xanthobacter agilis]MDQ0503389.1 hypothetical protein [Xanthobacter agilis]
MKHDAPRAARVRAVVATLAVLAGAPPVQAQLQILDLNELPEQRNLTPMNRLLPTDPHVVIRAYLAKHLPSLWWGRESQFSPGRTTVEIHLPEGWQGNPTAAMMGLCPQPNENIWRVFHEIEMRPFFQKKFWPSWTCRG